ncbi:MAG TPA: hypothetical protein VF635_07240, partial [Propionibacteriaceae bacterium]
GIVYDTALPLLLLWFLALAATYRFRLMDKMLGLQDLVNRSPVELDATPAGPGPAGQRHQKTPHGQ